MHTMVPTSRQQASRSICCHHVHCALDAGQWKIRVHTSFPQYKVSIMRDLAWCIFRMQYPHEINSYGASSITGYMNLTNQRGIHVLRQPSQYVLLREGVRPTSCIHLHPNSAARQNSHVTNFNTTVPQRISDPVEVFH